MRKNNCPIEEEQNKAKIDMNSYCEKNILKIKSSVETNASEEDSDHLSINSNLHIFWIMQLNFSKKNDLKSFSLPQ